jgi:hypothetical protein
VPVGKLNGSVRFANTGKPVDAKHASGLVRWWIIRARQ